MTKTVLIALPNHQGRVSPVFDVAARLLLVQLQGETELERREVVLFETGREGVARQVSELGIQVLICGAISQQLQSELEQMGIRVVAQVCGEIDSIISAYKTGKLKRREFIMPGCYGRRGKISSAAGLATEPKPSANSTAPAPGVKVAAKSV